MSRYELFRTPYFSLPHLACFDGAPPAEPPAAPPAEPPAASPAASQGNITQEKMNEILAKERAKYQASLAQAETTYQNMLANDKSLSEQDRKRLEENLEMVQGQLRTKEQQAELERKKLEETHSRALADANATAKTWEQRYHTETIDRVLLDAAVSNDAYSPNQVALLLKNNTKLVPVVDAKGKPTGQYNAVVELPVKDPTTGEMSVGTFSPSDAVKHMKDDPQYANQFKANVVGGLGANSAVGGIQPGANGQVDPSKLNHQQYRELRKNNPAALGLRPGGGRR